MADTTSRSRGMHPNTEMTTVGYVMAGVLVVLLLPLAPVFLLYVLFDRFTGASDGEKDRDWGAARPSTTTRSPQADDSGTAADD